MSYGESISAYEAENIAERKASEIKHEFDYRIGDERRDRENEIARLAHRIDKLEGVIGKLAEDIDRLVAEIPEQF